MTDEELKQFREYGQQIFREYGEQVGRVFREWQVRRDRQMPLWFVSGLFLGAALFAAGMMFAQWTVVP